VRSQVLRHHLTRVMVLVAFAAPIAAPIAATAAAATGCALLTDLDNLSTKPGSDPSTNTNTNNSNNSADGGDNGSGGDGGRNGNNTDGGPTISQGGRCDLAKPFGTPAALDPLNDQGENDRAARLSPDERTIYFSSDRSNSLRIYRATRARVEDAFGPPALVDELHSALAGGYAAALPSANGLELLTEYRAPVDGGGSRPSDFYLFTRAAASGPFSNPIALTALNTLGTETDPNFAADDRDLYLARSNGDNGTDLYVARRATASGGAFGPTNPLPGNVNTSSNESDPVLSVDGLELFLQSDRSGPARVWVSRRQSMSEPFPQPVHVSELDGTGENDVPNWLSPDRCVLYMTSFRQGNLAHLYVATRPR
jgi:Tol biopolymer transport system component